jgi:hypothetical protein
MGKVNDVISLLLRDEEGEIFAFGKGSSSASWVKETLCNTPSFKIRLCSFLPCHKSDIKDLLLLFLLLMVMKTIALINKQARITQKYRMKEWFRFMIIPIAERSIVISSKNLYSSAMYVLQYQVDASPSSFRLSLVISHKNSTLDNI